MSILKAPSNIIFPENALCVLCERSLSLADATLGPINAEGRASLLCGGHLWDGLRFIDMLADYMAVERQKYLNGQGSVVRFGGVASDAWSIY